MRYASSDRLYRTTDRVFHVAACAGCGLLRMEPRPGPVELKAYYPARYWFAPEGGAAGRLEEVWRRLVVRDHVRFVRRALREAGEDGPVLDVGCGGGLFLRMMKEAGHEVVGLDAGFEAAHLAWSRNGVPVVCGILEQLPLAASRCAAVTMFHVLEHVPDPRAYLEAARELLRPAGRLIVQTPDAACWERALLGRRWSGLDVPRHLFSFRGRDLELLAASCGFQVLRRKHFSLRDNPAGLATSLAPALDPMARRVRGLHESGAARLSRDLLYFALVLAALPVTLVEAAFRAGSTIMLEACKR
jgi:SAM-dependent methyltransferase